MGKKSGASWLTVVKRAFRSPSKDSNEKKGSRRREEDEQEEEEKKREKRRWLFKKHTNNVIQVQQQPPPPPPPQQQQQQREEKVVTDTARATVVTPLGPILCADQRHAIAVATATAAAAQAAAVTAQAAAEIVRLTRSCSFVREQRAAVVIQTAFRGYLARRALRALRGLVKLQALVRGQNVRKQAKLTLKCMQALVRVQDRIKDQQRARLSHDGIGSRPKSIFSDINVDLWGSNKYLHDVRERKSMSRDVSSTLDDWDDQPRAIEEIEAIVQCRKEAALKREKALANAFSSQMWRCRRKASVGDEEELEERSKRMERWMATKQRDNSSRSRASTSDSRMDIHIKTVEVDTTTPPTTSRPHTAYQYSLNNHTNATTTTSATTTTTPRRRSIHHCHLNHQQRPQTNSPLTPSPCKPKPLQVLSASPRCLAEERCYSVAHTPSFGSRNNNVAGVGRNGMVGAIPNYMAATESAKAKARSQSAPRQRPSTPERDRGSGGSGVSSSSSSARKRLSFPVPPEAHYGMYSSSSIGRNSFSQNLRSPSFKSLSNACLGLEQRSNYSSCYTESVISPCSTTDLWWLK